MLQPDLNAIMSPDADVDHYLIDWTEGKAEAQERFGLELDHQPGHEKPREIRISLTKS